MVIAFVPGSILPRFRFVCGETAEMTQPCAGHAATAPGTPSVKRSANKTFARFCTLTTPRESDIWEFTNVVEEEYFGGAWTVPTAAGLGLPAVPEDESGNNAVLAVLAVRDAAVL